MKAEEAETEEIQCMEDKTVKNNPCKTLEGRGRGHMYTYD